MSKPIRVAFVSVLPSPYQRDLFAALAVRDDVEPHIFYMEKSAADSPWPDRALAAHESYIPGFHFRLGHARVHVNWRLPCPRNYDVIVCNTIMSVTGQWLMRAKLRNARWMFWGEKLGPRSRKHDILTSPLHRASGIAAIGTWAERDYIVRFPNTPVFNIPYHCTIQPFLDAPHPEREPGTITFLFCGQMIARKGLKQLMSAFATMPENSRLMLIGREAELPQLLAALPQSVCSRIRYEGFQAPEALPHFFSQADVFVLPSRYDGWGVVVNQALGAGLPIITSDQVGAAHDLVRENENGFRFPAGNTSALGETMSRFINTPSLCEMMSASSRTFAAGWHPANGAELWANALKSVCK